MAYYEESAKIVSRAIRHLGTGNKGLAEQLKKNPSLVSRYASGEVRPKAETLLKCIQIIGADDLASNAKPFVMEHTYETMLNAINGLSPTRDHVLINALLGVLALAKKVPLENTSTASNPRS